MPRLEILRDGRAVKVRQFRRVAEIHPLGFLWVDPRRATWAALEGGRLTLHRGSSVFWRSSGRFGGATAARTFDWLTVSRWGIAFTVTRSKVLYMVSGRGSERRVAMAEWPQLWTRSGTLITSFGRRGDVGYRVRSNNGRLLTTLATDLGTKQIDDGAIDTRSRALLWWTDDGRLIRSDGRVTTQLADYDDLGFHSEPSVAPLDHGLVQLLGRGWRGVVLHSDGSVFARASAPTDGSVAGFGEQLASPDGSMVAYVLTRIRTGGVERGTTVYVLKQDDVGGEPIYSTRQGTTACDLPLAWHGHWLLYQPSGSPAVLIDATGAHAPIRLPRVRGAERGWFSWARPGLPQRPDERQSLINPG